jgi:hypothetical protein
MQKWPVHAAIGRSRPFIPFCSARIAKSDTPRTFHQSSRNAEAPNPQGFRREYAAKSNERSSSATRSIVLDPNLPRGAGGIDLRSLAAKPPGNARSRMTPRPGKMDARNLANARSAESTEWSESFDGDGRAPGAKRRREPSQKRERGGDGKSRRPNRGSDAGFKKKEFEFSSEEQAYLKERKLSGMPQPVPFEPSLASTFVGVGPSIILGERGTNEVVNKRLQDMAPAGIWAGGLRQTVLAKEFLKGNFVRFTDDAEKEAVLEMAREISAKEARLKSEETGAVVEPATVEFETLDAEAKTTLMQELVGGSYAGLAAYDDKDLLHGVLRNLQRNGSYPAAEQARLAAKIRSLLPVAASKKKVTSKGTA